jgi:hypothetical protein
MKRKKRRRSKGVGVKLYIRVARIDALKKKNKKKGG